jgi:hypothetical protein
LAKASDERPPKVICSSTAVDLIPDSHSQMKLHVANHVIALAPAGIVVLVVCIAILVLSIVAIVRIARRRGQP